MPPETSVVVLVPTYRRAAQLEQLLSALKAQTFAAAAIVVCDNDVHLSARPVCMRLGVRYLTEGRAGVTAVRNTLLDAVQQQQYLAFIDDDELPPQDWLERLLGTAAQEGVDVVGAPVAPAYPADIEHWTIRGRAHEHGNRPRGRDERLFPSTNNCIVLVDAWRRAGSPRFDERFGATGGEDTDWFWRLRRQGLAFFWEPGAEVTEAVTSDRLTTAWFVRRGMQNGWVHGTLLMRDHRAPVVVAAGIVRIGLGMVGALAQGLRHGSIAPGLKRALAGVGFLRAAASLPPGAYGRAPQAASQRSGPR